MCKILLNQNSVIYVDCAFLENLNDQNNTINMAGTVVKCVYEFVGEVDTDLSLSLGDLIKITNVVSDDWYEGTCNGKSGQFPKAFVEAVESTGDLFEMALAVANFPGEQEGDIALKEGEVVIITEIIDDNWAVGHTHGGNKGTFPRAFIKQISFEDIALKNALQASVEPQNESTETENKCFVEGTEYNVYTAISPFVAQGESELNIVVGENIEVLSVYDDFWLEGKTQNGKIGIFPRMCIDYPEETIEIPTVVDSDISLTEVEVEEIPVEYPPENEMLYATFDYNSSVEGDLSFEIGAKIKLVEIIDENWYKGELDGVVGVFPANHVEKVPENSLNNKEKTEKSYSENQAVEKLSSVVETVQVDSEKVNKQEHLIVLKPEQPVPKPARKPAPTRPSAGPKKPPLINNTITESSVPEEQDKLEKPDKPEKPKKKAPPERPKMPSKKDLFPPFSFIFSTESQPTVIIPGEYVKPGEPNVIILRRSVVKST